MWDLIVLHVVPECVLLSVVATSPKLMLMVTLISFCV